MGVPNLHAQPLYHGGPCSAKVGPSFGCLSWSADADPWDVWFYAVVATLPIYSGLGPAEGKIDLRAGFQKQLKPEIYLSVIEEAELKTFFLNYICY